MLKYHTSSLELSYIKESYHTHAICKWLRQSASVTQNRRLCMLVSIMQRPGVNPTLCGVKDALYTSTIQLFIIIDIVRHHVLHHAVIGCKAT